jgi:hypothetical protein
VDGIRLGFVGKSSTWNVLRGLVFPEHVLLRYVGNEEDCLGLDLVIVERYMADLVHCPRTLILSDLSVDGIIEAIIKGLRLNELNIGIDMGNSRCGVIILINELPVIHVTLGFIRLIRIIRRLSRQLTINLIIGTSPGVSSLVKDFLNSLSDVNIRIRVIDEGIVNGKKDMFKYRYPYLTLDELDGLIYAYAGLAMNVYE